MNPTRLLLTTALSLALALSACGGDEAVTPPPVDNNDTANNTSNNGGTAGNNASNNDDASNNATSNNATSGNNDAGSNNAGNNASNNATSGNNASNNATAGNNATNNATTGNNGTLACERDADCPDGQVCELGGEGCDTPTCVAGCHDVSDCGQDDVCAQVECATCPCPGQCAALPEDPDCRSDADCPDGQVCELGGEGCDTPTCVEGCRGDGGCGFRETCTEVECVTCPCPNQCEQDNITPDCITDGDCPDGEVCEFGGDLCIRPVCVPGCSGDADCPDGQVCGEVECATCPCPDQCQDPDVDPACELDADCPDGQVCEPGAGCFGNNTCVDGCHLNTDCPDGQRCRQQTCLTCPCPGVCEPTTGEGDCASDGDCPDGQVCEGGGEACGTLTCVPGCRTAEDCSQGEDCVTQFCVTCPCPSICEGGFTEPECRGDFDCGGGQVCTRGGDDCATPVCAEGCRRNNDCPRGQRCQEVECATCPCPNQCE